MHPLPIPLPLGSNVPRHAFLRRVPGASSLVVPAGEILVREGEPSKSVFAIDRGAVALSSTSSVGRSATLAILGPGDAFGFEALLLAEEAGPGLWPEARALVASRTVAISMANLRAARAFGPTVDEWVLQVMALRLDELGTRLLRSLTLPVVHHVQLVLRDLAMVHGRQVADGLRIELPLSQEAIAALVGSTRESVNRAMHSLSERGLVRRLGRRYVLPAESLAHSEEPTSPNRRSGP
jgi:CRP/FNR family cyclic AMP-dependent transcriptional regulator